MAKRTTTRKRPVKKTMAVSTGVVGQRTMSTSARVVTAFDAGKSHRRLKGVPTAQAMINSQIRRYGRTVIARSRYLCNNNHYASNAKELFKSALVGAGIKPSPLVEQIELKRELQLIWYDWCDQADADGLTDFYGLQGLCAAEIFEAGEVFVRLRKRRPEDGLLVPLQLQLLPAEMLDWAYNEELANGRRIEMGIQFDPIGRREGYHFWRFHPYGDMGPRYERVFVPAEQVLHLFQPRIVGQIRGIPHTIASIAKLAMMDQYDDAELERKRVAALFTGFVTRGLDADDDDHPLEEASAMPLSGGEDADVVEPDAFANVESGLGYGLEPGAMVDLEEGENVKFAEPADVGGNYEVFQYRTLLAVAAGFGVPYADMTGDLRQTNYGSIRAGLIAFRRRIEAMQHQMMVFQFCRPVRAAWLEAAVMANALVNLSPSQLVLQRPLVSRVKWIPPKWEWVDPWKDRQAEKLAVDNGFKSKSDVQEAEGYDPEETDERIAADQEREERLGLELPAKAKSAPPAAPGQPGQQPAPRDPEEDDAEGQEEDEEGEEKKRPVYAVHLHMPQDGKKRTKITRFDDKGRAVEMESEPA